LEGTLRQEQNLWGIERMTMKESIQLTIDSMCAYGEKYRHWAIAYSGGKDSSATVTLIVHLIESGRIPKPETLTVLYADTRMELPPLHACAMNLLSNLESRGVRTQVVLPELDDRFFVYMFGRGVPAPKNLFRWCTPQLKVEPMEQALADLRAQHGEKFLMITGVREGESAARDERITLSCSKDGAECGQGWFQIKTPEAVADTLAPLLHWRVCHIWDWLTFFAPQHGFATEMVAEVYGGDEKEEINARTGCIGCNLASKDVALDTVLKLPQWQYLAPLKRLRPLYQEMMKPVYRVRKVGERKKDGTLSKSNMRMGPYTMEARRYGLSQVLSIQEEVNTAARLQDRPLIDLINDEEHDRILELIETNTWPQKWTGEEIRADEMVTQVVAEGVMQDPLWLSHALEEV
jgi:DNA sulfur modification protein DndC